MIRKGTPKSEKSPKQNKLALLIETALSYTRYYLSIPLVPYLVFFIGSFLLNLFIPMEVFPLFIRIYCSLILLLFGLTIYYLSWRTIRKYVERIDILEVQPALVLFEGMFRYSRNPVFIAAIFMFVALSIFLNNAWGVLLVPFLVFTLNKFTFPPREYLMREEYGALFDDYAHKVGRWI